MHRRNQPVEVYDEELRILAASMVETMYAADGVGLAACQIGRDVAMFVFDCPDAEGQRVVGVVCNPVLTLPEGKDRELEESEEGCLSLPGAFVECARPDYATVEGFGLDGEPVRFSGNGLLSRCLQHETDHTLGTVFGDRLPTKLRKKLQKAHEKTSARLLYDAAPRSTGALPPDAAAAQLAVRNSSLVATRSWARVRLRSGSSSRTWVFSGIRSTSSSMSSTSAGARDSMPSTACPSASLPVISRSSGWDSPSCRARSLTSSVSSSSRQGGAHSRSALSRERWSATAKDLISSTSSPQNSTRSGCSSVGGKTSTMPPRTANSPRFSTRSTRVYAAPLSRRTTSSRSCCSPTASSTRSVYGLEELKVKRKSL